MLFVFILGFMQVAFVILCLRVFFFAERDAEATWGLKLGLLLFPAMAPWWGNTRCPRGAVKRGAAVLARTECRAELGRLVSPWVLGTALQGVTRPQGDTMVGGLDKWPKAPSLTKDFGAPSWTWIGLMGWDNGWSQHQPMYSRPMAHDSASPLLYLYKWPQDLCTTPG